MYSCTGIHIYVSIWKQMQDGDSNTTEIHCTCSISAVLHARIDLIGAISNGDYMHSACLSVCILHYAEVQFHRSNEHQHYIVLSMHDEAIG